MKVNKDNYLIIIKELEKYKSRDYILINCQYCNNELYKRKNYIQFAIKNNRNIYCNKKCFNLFKTTKQAYACLNCNEDVIRRNSDISKSGKIFCSNKCFSIYSNSKRAKKKYYCTVCNYPTLPRRKYCDDCRNKDYYLKDVIYDKHHRSSAYALVRYKARVIANKYNMNICKNCGYDKHVEIAHIKPISEFSETSLLSEINNIDNLISLCRNCHWEFDNDLLIL